MDPQALDLARQSGRASLPYAAGLAVILTLVGWIPCINCIAWPLLVLGGPFAIGFLVTPKLIGLPPGLTKGMLALYIGLGIGVAVTIAFVIASLASGLLGLILGGALSGLFGTSQDFFLGAAGGVVNIIIGVIAAAFVGLTLGTLMAFLGSYLSLDRHRSVEVTRPF